MNKQFTDIIQLIKQSRENAVKAVNLELINLYWNIGAHISKEINSSNWGEKTVDELAYFIQNYHPELKGFNRRGLYRMKQFYETYADSTIVSLAMTQLQVADNKKNTIVSLPMTQLKKKKKNSLEIVDIRKTILGKISWTNHLTLITRCKENEEREFYLKLCIKEKYSVKELDRQISSGLFERVAFSKSNYSDSLKEIHPEIADIFKDSYVFEFLNLPDEHNESDLQKGLIKRMKNFILELGKDFLFISEEYKLQVGNSDFYVDLLFYHRGLQCLVVFELKNDKFKPEYLGQINFYLEALDRDVKKENENPSIGILICKDEDSEVVKYALSRSLSPTMVSQYKTQLPDKELLQQKLNEYLNTN